MTDVVTDRTLDVFYNEADRDKLLAGLEPSEQKRTDEAAREALEAGFQVMPAQRAEALVDRLDLMRYESEIQDHDGESLGYLLCGNGDEQCAMTQLPRLKAPPEGDPLARDGLARALERVQQVWEKEIGALVERERERLDDPSIEPMVAIREDGLYLALGEHEH